MSPTLPQVLLLLTRAMEQARRSEEPHVCLETSLMEKITTLLYELYAVDVLMEGTPGLELSKSRVEKISTLLKIPKDIEAWCKTMFGCESCKYRSARPMDICRPCAHRGDDTAAEYTGERHTSWEFRFPEERNGKAQS